MSAFMVSSHHIAAIVGTYVAMALKSPYHRTEVENVNPEEFAKTLYRQNLRSVDERYSHNAEALADFNAAYASDPVTVAMIRQWQARPLSPGQLFKALDCLEYQSDCTDDWELTEARKLCQHIRKLGCYATEGYEAMTWTIDAPPERPADAPLPQPSTEDALRQLNHGIDARNMALLIERCAKRDARKGLRIGDYLRMPDGTLRRFTHDWGDDIQTTTPGEDGSFHLDRFGGVSYSGSLDDALLKARMSLTAETLAARFWFFRDDEMRAHNGIHVSVPCRIYRLDC